MAGRVVHSFLNIERGITMPKKTVPPGRGPGDVTPVPGFRPGVSSPPGHPQGRKAFDPAAIRGPRGARRGPYVRRPPMPGKSRGR
jgi:hypothetical protein